MCKSNWIDSGASLSLCWLIGKKSYIWLFFFISESLHSLDLLIISMNTNITQFSGYYLVVAKMREYYNSLLATCGSGCNVQRVIILLKMGRWKHHKFRKPLQNTRCKPMQHVNKNKAKDACLPTWKHTDICVRFCGTSELLKPFEQEYKGNLITIMRHLY